MAPALTTSVKVYCDRCGSLFGSRAEFDRHAPGHSEVEACPIDTALSRAAGAVRRLFNLE